MKHKKILSSLLAFVVSVSTLGVQNSAQADPATAAAIAGIVFGACGILTGCCGALTAGASCFYSAKSVDRMTQGQLAAALEMIEREFGDANNLYTEVLSRFPDGDDAYGQKFASEWHRVTSTSVVHLDRLFEGNIRSGVELDYIHAREMLALMLLIVVALGLKETSVLDKLDRAGYRAVKSDAAGHQVVMEPTKLYRYVLTLVGDGRMHCKLSLNAESYPKKLVNSHECKNAIRMAYEEVTSLRNTVAEWTAQNPPVLVRHDEVPVAGSARDSGLHGSVIMPLPAADAGSRLRPSGSSAFPPRGDSSLLPPPPYPGRGAASGDGSGSPHDDDAVPMSGPHSSRAPAGQAPPVP